MKTHQGTRAATSEGGPRESRCELWRHAVTVPVPDTRPRPYLPLPRQGLLQTRRCKPALGALRDMVDPTPVPCRVNRPGESTERHVFPSAGSLQGLFTEGEAEKEAAPGRGVSEQACEPRTGRRGPAA